MKKKEPMQIPTNPELIDKINSIKISIWNIYTPSQKLRENREVVYWITLINKALKEFGND